jgi:hypothetical protein
MTSPIAENYTPKRVGIILGSVAAVYIAYALVHALFAPAGPLAAGAAGYGAGILAHKFWS